MSPPRDDDSPSADDDRPDGDNGGAGDRGDPDPTTAPRSDSDSQRGSDDPDSSGAGSDGESAGGLNGESDSHDEAERRDEPTGPEGGRGLDGSERWAGDDVANNGGNLDGPTAGGGPDPSAPTAEGDADPSASAERTRNGTASESTHRGEGPAPRRAQDDADDENAVKTFLFDVVSSATAVLLVGALLFAVSGVWPPMVAIESPSMTPHMKTGDLVFVMEEQRFPGQAAQPGTGVVTAAAGAEADYEKFAEPGDVIVYKPGGDGNDTPIIHRAMLWVEEGEDWYEQADRQSVGGYSECGEEPDEAMPNCPAPHAGFITKGDANTQYDQVQGLSGPVKPAWVVGTAEVRIPKLGCIRLRSQECLNGVAGETDCQARAQQCSLTNRTSAAP